MVGRVNIRNGATEDRDFIEHLGKRTVMDNVAASRVVSPVMVVESFDRLMEIVEGREHLALIAEVDGKRVGFALIVEDMADEVTGQPQAFVAYMAVERTTRGRGVGAALVEAAEREARKRDLPYMALMVTEENEPARRLYDRAGYVTERRLLCKKL